MPTTDDGKPLLGVNNVPPSSEVPQNPVDSLFSLIEPWCAAGGLQKLQEMLQENKKLAAEANRFQVAYHENIRALGALENTRQMEQKQRQDTERARQDAVTRLEQERKGSQGLRDSIGKLEEQVKGSIEKSKSLELQIMKFTNSEKAKASELEKASKARAELERDLRIKQEDLASKTTDLVQVQQNLETIRSFIVVLGSVTDKETAVRNILSKLFDLALNHMEAFLLGELDNACLADSSSWKELRMRVSGQHRILPLLASNSPAAKRMRVLAGLVILGESLAQNIFRPIYITQSDELDDVLDHLGAQDPLHEIYVRAALLKVLPGRQKKNQEAAAQSVVAHVSTALRTLIPSSRREEFASRLRLVLEEMCDGWSQVQKVTEKVKPSFSFEYPEEWQQLPPARPPRSSHAKPSSPSSSSSSAQSSTQSKNKDGNQSRQKSTNDGSGTLTNKEFRGVAWPAFLSTSDQAQGQDDDDGNGNDASPAWILLHHGYVITEAQVREAEQERAAEESASRRARTSMRQDGGGDPRQPQRKRRDSGIFFLARMIKSKRQYRVAR